MNYERLIGVIDLKSGRAVRAVQGRREQYQPVESFRLPAAQVELRGNPDALAECYSRYALASLYIADLDGLTGKPYQFNEIDRLLDLCDWPEPPLVDFGLTGSESDEELSALDRLVEKHDTRIIVATESAGSTHALDLFAQRFPRESVVVSLDYRNGDWVSDSATESEWLAACIDNAVGSVVVLDVATVGTESSERSAALCNRISPQLSNISIITGGGVRHESDVNQLVDAGAERVLVASMFVR
ncbi:MAG: HisA/HisF-related TIM barrel protein [Planctomycetota bacterium]